MKYPNPFNIALVLCLLLFAASANAEFVDLRSYIDGTAVYTMTDSLDTATQYSDSVWVAGCTTIACNIFVSPAIVTNVVVRLLCSHNGINWMNADKGHDTTLTATGQYSMVFRDAMVFRYYKLYWVSEAGGTSTKLLVSFRVGGGI